jgi:excisionase family DNA binding protein
MTPRRLTARPLDDIDTVLSIPTAAAALDISHDTLQRIIARGELRMIRITPRRVGIRRSELERYITSREVAA